MEGSWWFRFWLVVTSVVAAVWLLIPTFLGQSQADLIAAQASAMGGGDEVADEIRLEWYWDYLPDVRIVKGLDLQGGIDLTLEVGTDEAVLSSVARDVQPMEETAEREGVDIVDIRRVRGEAAIEILPGEGVGLDAINGLLAGRYVGYAYESSREDAEGLTWHRYVLDDDQQAYVAERAVEQALETLRSRVDATGVKEPSILLKGGNRINVQLPGLENVEQAVDAIGTTAVLEFYAVDEAFDDAKLEKAITAARDALTPEDFAADDALNDWLVETGRLGRNNRVLWEYAQDQEGGDVRKLPYVLLDRVVLTGDDVNDASVGMDQYNQPYVALEFKPPGARIFAEYTGENVGKRFAIVLDRKVKSAPYIKEKIAGGRASISMGDGGYQQQLDDASVLSLVLRTGALPAPVKIGEVRTVGASLGEDSIIAGVEATGIGAAAVVLFMSLFYRNRATAIGVVTGPGMIANLSLALNLVFIMALLAGFEATLTLPGIAGIALTVGMAVDANIIIFERIREELRTGKNARAAVDAGFDNGLTAVIDANITTAIAGVVLYSYGSGPIKGFAVTLLIGICTTLFTTVFVSRTFMDLLVRKSSTRLAI